MQAIVDHSGNLGSTTGEINKPQIFVRNLAGAVLYRGNNLIFLVGFECNIKSLCPSGYGLPK